MTIERENRPAGEPDGLHKNSVERPSSIAQFAPSEAMRRADSMYVLMVFAPEKGRYRRRVYLNLPAAERAALRARERGHIAHVVLGTFAAVEVVR